MRYIGSCNIDRIPELYASDYLEGWSLMSWIEGERPVSLDSSDFIEITTFIMVLTVPLHKERAKLHPASEAIQSSSCLLNSISKRIQGLKSVVPKTQICSEAIAWVDRIIEPYFYVLPALKECNQTYRKNLSSQAIASPSDVGIHNLIRSKEGLYFFDFEYAGLDDLSKLTADWILQPEYRLNAQQRNLLVDSLLKAMAKNLCDSWVDRLNDILPLIHLKWCLIMLNEVRSGMLKAEQFSKVVNYYIESVQEI